MGGWEGWVSLQRSPVLVPQRQSEQRKTFLRRCQCFGVRMAGQRIEKIQGPGPLQRQGPRTVSVSTYSREGTHLGGCERLGPGRRQRSTGKRRDTAQPRQSVPAGGGRAGTFLVRPHVHVPEQGTSVHPQTPVCTVPAPPGVPSQPRLCLTCVHTAFTAPKFLHF